MNFSSYEEFESSNFAFYDFSKKVKEGFFETNDSVVCVLFKASGSDGTVSIHTYNLLKNVLIFNVTVTFYSTAPIVANIIYDLFVFSIDYKEAVEIIEYGICINNTTNNPAEESVYYNHSHCTSQLKVDN